MGILAMMLRTDDEGAARGRTALKEASFVVVDTELTGLDEREDSIVSIGAVRLKAGRIVIGDTFYRIADPGREIPGETVVIHGITPSEAAGGVGVAQAVSEFLEYAGTDVLVGHCLAVDLAFLAKGLGLAAGRRITNHAVDTYAAHLWLRRHSPRYHRMSPGFEELGLYALAKKFGIDTALSHNALTDAFITAQLFQRFIPFLMEAGIGTVEGLANIADPSKGGESYVPRGEFGNF